jgi:hypothetical protein
MTTLFSETADQNIRHMAINIEPTKILILKYETRHRFQNKDSIHMGALNYDPL